MSVRTSNLPLIAALAVMLVAGGCSKESVPAVGTSGTSPPQAATENRAAPDSAVAAVQTVIEQLKANRLEAIWDFLPATYQQDLNDLVHAFAARMDPELWNRGVAALRKFTAVLKSKKEFLAAEMDGVAEVLATLLSSELADLEKLAVFDGRKFLAVTGDKLRVQLRSTGFDPFAGSLEVFNDMRVKPVRSDGNSAILSLEVEDEPPTEHEFVRVEGKWVPRTLADGWIEQMGEARARLVLLSPDNMADLKPQFLSLLDAVDHTLDELAAAGTREEFQAALRRADTALAPFKPLFTGQTGAKPASSGPTSDQPVELVTVVVKSPLDEDAQDELRSKLNAASDDPARSESEITGDDEMTTIRVGPVKDIEDFAKRLDFLKVVEIDAKSRTIVTERR